jgi:nitrite reductase (NADH) small subunit
MNRPLMPAPTAEWIEIGRVDDFLPRAARIVSTPNGEIGVFRSESGGFFAIDNRCPHRQGPLSEGIVHGESVACPLHNWVINLRTGRAEGADEGCVRTFRVKAEEGKVFISLGEG